METKTRDMEKWRHRDINMETWTRRLGDMDKETWTMRHGHGDIDIQTWAWRHGIKIKKSENGSQGDFS